MPRYVLLAMLAALLSLPGPSEAQEEQELRISSLPRRCGVCHLEKTPSRGGAFNFLSLKAVESPGAEGVCYSCHNGLVRDSRRTIWSGLQHRADDPSGEPGRGQGASCGTCHDPHIQTGGVGTFMRFARGYSGHCVLCHPDRRGGREGEHPAIGAGQKGEAGCGTCHRVHQAAGRGLVRAGADGQLCVSCHGENPSRKGKGPGGASHPVDDKDLACTACHRSHRSAGKGLIKKEVGDSSLCRQCHDDRSSGEQRGTNHPLLPGRVECLSCHRSHNAVDLPAKTALLASPPGALDSSCRGCHSSMSGGDEGWNHPVGSARAASEGSMISRLADYGGIFGEDSEVICLSCHRSHNALRGTAQLVVSRQALCLYCHKEQNSLAPKLARFGTHPVSVRPDRASIAAPLLEAGGKVGAGGELICLTCHRIHSGERGTAGLVLPPDRYACTLCHAEKGEIASTPHNLGEGGDPCLGCHGQHGWSIPLESVSMGGSVIEKVCWYCHGPEGSSPMSDYFGHIVGIPPSGSTGGRDLPLFWQDGRRLQRGLITCATCHDPHRSPAASFLRVERDERKSDLCLGCHRRQEVVKDTKHDISSYFPGEKNRRGESAAETGPCAACHLVHSGGPGKSWARAVSAAPGEAGALSDFCSDCHSEGSFAQGKTVEERLHPHQDALAERPGVQPVECDGCHDVHLWNPLDPSDRGDFFTDGDGSTSFLLSPATGQSRLCRSCHGDKAEVEGTKHDFAGAEKAPGDGSLCGACHLPHGGDAVLMWPLPAEDAESYGSHTCFSCHGGDGENPPSPLAGDNHPTGVSPSSDPSEDLPLYLPSGRRYYRGKVSCGTCHDPHRWSPVTTTGSVAISSSGPTTSFLRLPADGFSPLCFPCHSDRSMVVGTDHDLRVTAPGAVNSDGLTADDSGVCGSCHRVHGATYTPGLWNRALGAGEDPQSRYCRSCHDDGGLEEATVPPRFEVHLVSYPGKGMVSRIFTQRQSSLMNISSALSLYDEKGEAKNRGYISCVTCHDAHRWEPDTNRSGTGVPLEGDSRNSFLKVRSTFSVGQSLCIECHGDESLELYQGYHFPPRDGSPEGAPPSGEN